MVRRIRIFLLAAIVGSIGLELMPPAVSEYFVTTVQAIVGRPLTPVSVAGVARRTARRCAVFVYPC